MLQIGRDFFFNETDHSEEAFKKIFPEAKYDKFISPYDMNFPMNVSKKKIQKVAFQLTEHIPLKYETLYNMVYWLYYDRERKGLGKKAIMFQLLVGNEESKNLYLDCTIKEKLKEAIAS